MSKYGYDYCLSFESEGQRLRKDVVGINITDAIKRVRKDNPDARMFSVIKKVKKVLDKGEING
jgi:hypothetical protein